MLEMASAADPEFETVTVCGALVVPTVCAVNDSIPGDRPMTGATTPPEEELLEDEPPPPHPRVNRLTGISNVNRRFMFASAL
jgi:hypothetical protein